MKMSYFLAPEEIFEDPKLAKKWTTLAFDAALRNKIKRPGKKTRQ
jgi:DNA transformation protein